MAVAPAGSYPAARIRWIERCCAASSRRTLIRAVSPHSWVSAIIDVESHGDPSAVSRAGAQGLMQLMPDTAATYGVVDAFDPEENVSGGCRYMQYLLKRYRGNVKLALAAYNAGPGVVDAAHGVPSYAETRAYVARVSAALHSTTQ